MEGETVAIKSQLNLHKHLRRKYIADLTNIKELYYERIEPSFSNAENEAEEYQKNYGTILCHTLVEKTIILIQVIMSM